MNGMIFFVVFLRMERFSCLLMSHQDIQNKHFKAIHFFFYKAIIQNTTSFIYFSHEIFPAKTKSSLNVKTRKSP